VSVFAADIKGDLSGIAAAGDGKEVFVKRAAEIGVEYQPDRFPVVFWDVFGEQGHPIRATVSEMGPLLLARLLELNDTQEGVLNVAFKVADDNGWPILDMKDLRALLQFVGDNAAEVGADTATSPRPRSPRSSASSSCSRTRAPTASSASRRST
jgi:DNA helicase HerA-like ATPase